MAITLTDAQGRQYRLSGTEEQLLQPLLEQNATIRDQLIAALVQFDSRRLKLCADVLAGNKVGEYGLLYPPTDPNYKNCALELIQREYEQSIRTLERVLAPGSGGNARPSAGPHGSAETNPLRVVARR